MKQFTKMSKIDDCSVRGSFSLYDFYDAEFGKLDLDIYGIQYRVFKQNEVDTVPQTLRYFYAK